MQRGIIHLCALICYIGWMSIVSAQEVNHFLSFIMPCYNCARTVSTSIDSIYNQNIHVPFEVICTDDGSIDETVVILRSYEEKYDNFHVYIHPNNLGAGATCNTCVQYAQGNLLFRLDSDNVLPSDDDLIDRLITLLNQTECDGATVEKLYFHEGDFVHNSEWVYRAENNISDIWHVMRYVEDPAASGNYLFTRKSFDKAGGYLNGHGADTFCFGFKQYATGSRIAVLPNSYYWHLVNPNGYWQQGERNGNNQKVAIATLLEFSEIFDPITIEHLKHLGNYTYSIQQGKMALRSFDIIQSIFTAHELCYGGNYVDAIAAWEKAIVLGGDAKKIQKQIENIQKNINKI